MKGIYSTFEDHGHLTVQLGCYAGLKSEWVRNKFTWHPHAKCERRPKRNFYIIGRYTNFNPFAWSRPWQSVGRIRGCNHGRWFRFNKEHLAYYSLDLPTWVLPSSHWGQSGRNQRRKRSIQWVYRNLILWLIAEPAGKARQRAPLLRKFGNLSVREILVVT